MAEKDTDDVGNIASKPPSNTADTTSLKHMETTKSKEDGLRDIDSAMYLRRRNERALEFLSSIQTSNTARDPVSFIAHDDSLQRERLIVNLGHQGSNSFSNCETTPFDQNKLCISGVVRKGSISANSQTPQISQRQNGSSGLVDTAAAASTVANAFSAIGSFITAGSVGPRDPSSGDSSSGDSDVEVLGNSHGRKPSRGIDGSVEPYNRNQEAEPSMSKQLTFPMVFAPIKPFSGKSDDRHRYGNNAHGGGEPFTTSNQNRTDQSFAYLLHPLHTLTSSAEDESGSIQSTALYQPSRLDDSGLQKSLQRSMHGLAGYVGSILDYTRLDEPRNDDSDSAKKTHAELLAAGLTLDQLRRLKASIIRVTREQDLELSTAAIGWVYFEKLIWKRYVVKDNRKLVAATCLFLALKINESREVSISRSLQAIQRRFEVSANAILDQEFSVFAELEFSLWVPRREFMPHFLRMFETIGGYRSLADYLGTIEFFLPAESSATPQEKTGH